jgi:hypothetical protein
MYILFIVTRGSHGEIVLDADFLAGFGTIEVPGELWRAVGRFAVWIEPALVAEWWPPADASLCRAAGTDAGRRRPRGPRWSGPSRLAALRFPARAPWV